jgi:hypothetical protein
MEEQEIMIAAYCEGFGRDKEHAAKALMDYLIPLGVNSVRKITSNPDITLLKEVVWNSLVGKNKLMDKICSQNVQNLANYYITIVKNEWVHHTQKQGRIAEMTEMSDMHYKLSDGELKDTLKNICRLDNIYQVPILASALGYGFHDLVNDYKSVKERIIEVLNDFGIDTKMFHLDVETHNLTNDTFRQRLLRGRRRLKELSYRSL